MALSIGTLVGYLQMDDTQFQQKADKADEKMDALKLQLDALSKINPDIKLEVQTQTDKLTELQAKLADLRAQSAEGLDVRVDMVAAMTELDAVQAKLRALNAEAVARPGGSGFADDASAADALAAATTNLGSAEDDELSSAIASWRQRQANSQALRDETAATAAAKSAWDSWTQSMLASVQVDGKKAQAQKAVLDAMNGLESANTKVSEAQRALNDLQKSGVATDDALTAASRGLAAAQIEQAAAAAAAREASDAAQTGGSLMEGILGDVDPAQLAVQLGTVLGVITAIEAAGAALPGVLGAAVGLTGALGGMAAAGAAAYEGLKDNSEAKSAIDGLKSDLTQLEQTAGQGVLNGLLSSVKDLQGAMPAVNSEMASLSAALGTAGSSVVDGLVNGLKDAQPLLDEGAAVIEQWAAGFDSWTQDGGLQEFLNEAQQEMPTVVDIIDNLGHGMLELFDDLNIVGPAVIKMLDDVTGLADKALTAGDNFNHWVASLFGVKGASDAASASAKKLAAQVAATGPGLVSIWGDTVNLAAVQADATSKTNALATALQGLDQGSISADQAMITFKSDVAAVTSSVATNGRTLDENTAKGRANMTAVDSLASAALQLVAAQAKAGDSAQTLTGTMDSARAQFIAAAEAAGDTAQQAEALADKYGLVPKTVQTDISAYGVSAAEQQILGWQEMLDNIPGSVLTSVGVSTSAASVLPQFVNHKALGGTVDAIHAAVGMTVPNMGTGYYDQVDMKLAPGEEVISNWNNQASNFRPTLKAINAGFDADTVAGTLGGGGGSGMFQGTLVLDSGEFLGVVSGALKQSATAGRQKQEIWR